jgi:Zn-dependent protease
MGHAAMLWEDWHPLFGGRSFRLATILGIRVGVDVSWFVVLFVFIFWLSGSFGDVLDDETLGFAAAVVAVFALFGSILLHEIGHALAARRQGIDVNGIDLFFFGGVMKMSRDTATPGQEFKVAIAGPVVTLGLVGVGALASIALAGAGGAWDTARLEGDTGVVELLVSFFVSMNVLLLVFNLVPAFPLDGGRVARAVAWKLTGDRGRATRISARLGQLFAAVLIGLGLYQVISGDTWGLWWVVLGWLLGSSARAAVAQSAFSERLEGVTVADIMDREPVTITASLPVRQAYDEFFLRYQGWPWFAVVEEDGRFTGIAHRAAVEHAALHEDGDVPVRQVSSDVSGQVRDDAPLEALLRSEPLRREGAVMAVDADGRLRGVVTFEQVTRALQARLAPS